MIEATLKGVFSKNLQRLLMNKPENLAVYRSKVALTNLVKDKICEYAQSQIGSLYAIPEALLMLPMRHLKPQRSKKQFCSRLVACSYAYAGFDLQNLRDPNFCSPRQLSLCKAFEKLENVVREAYPAEIDLSETPDPTIKNLKDTYAWLNEVRELVSADPFLSQSFDIQTQNDVTELLLRHPELDSTVTAILRKTDYLYFFNHDRKANPYRYDIRLMLEKIIEFSYISEHLLLEELKKEQEVLPRYERNINAIIHHIGIARLNFFIEDLRLYRNLVSESITRMKVIAFASKVTNLSQVEKLVNHHIDVAKICVIRANKILGQ